MNHQTPLIRLFVGPRDVVCARVRSEVHDALCSDGVLCSHSTECVIDRAIDMRVHAQLIWLQPGESGQYKRAEIDALYERIRFAAGHTVVCVIESIDTMSAACGNLLLKTLEEPAANYMFVLTAERKEFVLPTVRSRAAVYEVARQEGMFGEQNERTQQLERFAQFFVQCLNARDTRIIADQIDQFELLFKEVDPQEHETFTILDLMVAQSQKLVSSAARTTVLQTVFSLYEHAPMPGSAKQFWRYVFMRIAD